MSGYAFAFASCIGLIAFLIVLLRTRRLREKYAVLWIIVGLGTLVLGAFPETATGLAKAVGVQTPSNLLFAIALIVLLLVGIQLSVEVTGLEEEMRTLVEEVALLRFDIDRLTRGPGGVPETSPRGSDTSAGPGQ
ncbi:hypothetical protein GALL_246930 [mine drainage metagenome]|uniref:DUF2304 domain-containing protein n=1 Tax=mine drainage metagenome TaxID=410659 RepID=A0A1J5RV69_9ZZZZ